MQPKHIVSDVITNLARSGTVVLVSGTASAAGEIAVNTVDTGGWRPSAHGFHTKTKVLQLDGVDWENAGQSNYKVSELRRWLGPFGF